MVYQHKGETHARIELHLICSGTLSAAPWGCDWEDFSVQLVKFDSGVHVRKHQELEPNLD